MAVPGQPTNETAPRPLVQGEAQEIEAQEEAMPTGPEQRGRPANPPSIELPQEQPPPPGEGTVPENQGTIAEVVPMRGTDFPQTIARPATVEEQVALAVLSVGPTTLGRRFALALAGFPQEQVYGETPPRFMEAPVAPLPPQIAPVPEALPEPEAAPAPMGEVL